MALSYLFSFITCLVLTNKQNMHRHFYEINLTLLEFPSDCVPYSTVFRVFTCAINSHSGGRGRFLIVGSFQVSYLYDSIIIFELCCHIDRCVWFTSTLTPWIRENNCKQNTLFQDICMCNLSKRGRFGASENMLPYSRKSVFVGSVQYVDNMYSLIISYFEGGNKRKIILQVFVNPFPAD